MGALTNSYNNEGGCEAAWPLPVEKNSCEVSGVGCESAGQRAQGIDPAEAELMELVSVAGDIGFVPDREEPPRCCLGC